MAQAGGQRLDHQRHRQGDGPPAWVVDADAFEDRVPLGQQVGPVPDGCGVRGAGVGGEFQHIGARTDLIKPGLIS